MKSFIRKLAAVAVMVAAAAGSAGADVYKPSAEVMKSREDFAADRFGIFLHWGIYSMFGQGEWYLNYGPTAEEYAKAAGGFYPADFNAAEWVSASRMPARNISA